MILVTAKMTLRPGTRETFVERVKAMYPPTRRERGCISYVVYTEAADDSHVLFVEEWESKDALEAHFETPHFEAFGEELPNLITGPVDASIHFVERSELL